MLPVKKFVVGLTPQDLTFRIDSLWGDIVDALLDARRKEIPEEYYNQVAESSGQSVVSLINAKKERSLYIDRRTIVLSEAAYQGTRVNLDEALDRFLSVYRVVNRVLRYKSIRRIGMVAEHRFAATGNQNSLLLNSLTKIPAPAFPASFQLHYESRKPTLGNDAPDKQTGDFTNRIYDIYDSSLDSETPVQGQINANIDYQRYYAPPIEKEIESELRKQFLLFKKELPAFQSQLDTWGIAK